MNSAETIERVPIHTDADGVVHVAGTRVTLGTIVAAFDAGVAAEEIAEQYSSVPLPDVYSVITYYLRTELKSPPTSRGERNRRQPFERKSSDGSLLRAYGNDC